MGLIEKIRTPRMIGDAVDKRIRQIAMQVSTVLLSGGDNGNGYAKSLAQISMSRYQPPFEVQPLRVFVNEHSPEKFRQLQAMYGNSPFLYTSDYFPTIPTITNDALIRTYYMGNPAKAKYITMAEAISGAKEEKILAARARVKNGVDKIKTDAGITEFGLAIIDATWLTSDKAWDGVTGSEYILLLDTNTIKNGDMMTLLLAHADYTRQAIHATTAQDDQYNNGNGVALFKHD